MKIIIETLTKAFNENLELVAILLIADVGTSTLNIIFGTIQGTIKDGFDVKKFFFGILKMLIWSFGVFGFCYFLNLISLAVDLMEKYLKVQIFTDQAQTIIVAVIDVITILFARIKDTCIDLTEKIKSMKTLKYISYDDIKAKNINDFDVDSNMDGII